jgi:hypothetical protein
LNGEDRLTNLQITPPGDETSPDGLDAQSRHGQCLLAKAFKQRDLTCSKEDLRLTQGKTALVLKKFPDFGLFLE